MSASPTLRRLSSSISLSQPGSAGATSKHEEELINAYEAEEERIVNLLSRKLEQLREEKIQLENALEAESESHVNRLSRELTALRILQQQQHPPGEGSSGEGTSANAGILGNALRAAFNDPRFPSTDAMLEAMRQENETLRSRLVDAERDYIRVTRLNDIYREELIEHRRRLGLPLDSLIGLPNTSDAYSQPTHRRRSSSSSPSTSLHPLPHGIRPSAPNGMPIPRPPSQIHRPSHHNNAISSTATTPLTTSPSSSLPTSPSPFPFSPPNQPASYLSQITTPPSSASMNPNQGFPATLPATQLTYPQVPPPSLSSSVGSPVATFASGLPSAHEPSHRRGSARIAETGSLRGRSRAGSLAAPRSASSSLGSALEV